MLIKIMGSSDTIVVLSELTMKQSLFNPHPNEAMFVLHYNIVY